MVVVVVDVDGRHTDGAGQSIGDNGSTFYAYLLPRGLTSQLADDARLDDTRFASVRFANHRRRLAIGDCFQLCNLNDCVIIIARTHTHTHKLATKMQREINAIRLSIRTSIGQTDMTVQSDQVSTNAKRSLVSMQTFQFARASIFALFARQQQQ